MLLRAANLSFAYPHHAGERAVLEDVSLSLAAGEVVALLGPNGSGKSTLIRCLLGQLPCSGEISWDGRSIRDWRLRDLARFIAYLPQSPTWDPTQSVRAALAMGRAPYWGAFGVESAQDEAVVTSVAGELQLSDLLDRRLDELSGGQRQRVLLGRCLIQQPKAMLLDEPNTYLDLKHQVELSRRLHALARERGIAVLMASHDLNLAAAFADRLILLDSGKVAADGAVADVLQPELLEKAFGVQMERIDRPAGVPVVIPKL